MYKCKLWSRFNGLKGINQSRYTSYPKLKYLSDHDSMKRNVVNSQHQGYRIAGVLCLPGGTRLCK